MEPAAGLGETYELGWKGYDCGLGGGGCGGLGGGARNESLVLQCKEPKTIIEHVYITFILW